MIEVQYRGGVDGGSAMASVEWRSIPTVLYPQEILDKAFGRASSQADLVEDPDKYHRVRTDEPNGPVCMRRGDQDSELVR